MAATSALAPHAVAVLSHDLLARDFHFSTGASNLLSTIDVSAGFDLFSRFSLWTPPAVAAAHYLPHLIALSVLLERRRASASTVPWFLGPRILAVCAFTVQMWLFQDHLFVWSVFAPKFVIEFASAFVSGALVVFLLV